MFLASNAAAMSRCVVAPVNSTTQWPYVYDEVFNKISPCNIMFDQSAVMVNIGNTIKQLFPGIQLGHSKLTDFFSIVKPDIKFTFNNVKTHQNAVFAFSPQSNHSSTEHNIIVIQGQIKMLQGETMAVFLGGIRKAKGTDDNNTSLGLVSKHSQMQKEREMMEQLEKTEIELKKAQIELEFETKNANGLVHSMLPGFVVKQLQQGKTAVHYL